MNELELAIIKKEFINSDLIILDYFRNNNLQDKLTLKEMASICNVQIDALFYLLSDFGNMYKSDKYIHNNPDVINMKISDIVNLK